MACAVAVENCDIAVTIVAGPLNHLGMNPKIACQTPQPSKQRRLCSCWITAPTTSP
ncbi:hypothetical protein SAMN05660976_08157 [Nonomuraea pusilla]|uniref:Uncharacterized protein n=1 Tax=Nonomuraea pusilla TaxID=46177 RepID=A0A1H8IV99_9ACTN|nr:hypothetical protein SAMN05660976_08157 [Nonomuraea pusilla]